MGRAGVEQLRRVRPQAGRQRDALPRGIIGQAEHDEVDRAHQLAPRVRILPACRIDAADRDARHVGQTLADAESRRPGFAIDEYGRIGHVVLLPGSSFVLPQKRKRGGPAGTAPLHFRKRWCG